MIADPAFDVIAGKWARFDGPAAVQPRDRAEMIAQLGDPTGGGKYAVDEHPDPNWLKARTVECHGPTALHPCAVHKYQSVAKVVEPYMREAFRRAELAAPGYIEVVSGPLVFRHMRHDPHLPLSNHAWGSAVDINPDDNGGKYAKDHHGKLPAPWTPEWFALWPHGMPLAIVRAFESCGFRWGGWWSGYADPMHMEWMATGAADQV